MTTEQQTAMRQFVARDRDGAVRASLPDLPTRRAAAVQEMARWRRAGWRVTHEFAGDARPGVTA